MCFCKFCQALPRLSLGNISYFLELGQLGYITNRTIYVHGDQVGITIRCYFKDLLSKLLCMYALLYQRIRMDLSPQIFLLVIVQRASLL